MRWLWVLALTSCATMTTATSAHLDFIEDDYPGALQQARARGVPLFVDAWAPWCHSCVFLKQHVLNAPELAAQDKRYVFLSLDTEKAKNAGFLEKYPVDVWPTLFIIDPMSETAVLKWLGTGTVEQLTKLLDDGELAVRDDASALAKADRLYAERSSEAVDAYLNAFNAMPKEHPRRGRALESLLNAQYRARQYTACADVAVQNVGALPRGPSFVNAVDLGLSCAALAKRGIEVLEPLALEALTLDGILADDRSGLYEDLVDLRTDRKDEAGAKELALEWLVFLEGEAAKARTPAARAVFDSHRVQAAIDAKEPLRAEAALKQSETDMPEDYNPPARLALIYREAGRYDEALATLERAFKRAYGPRKLRLYETKASILAKKGDVAGQKAAYAEALAYGNALPRAQRSDKVLSYLEGELKKLP
jgi:thioredoxin-like negative regulator of GroEL